MVEPARTGRQRRADSIARLEQVGADAWVATGSAGTAAHLIPLSYAWIGAHIVLAAPADSITVRNIVAAGGARLGIGPTRDVVLIDAELERLLDVNDDAARDTADAYAKQARWDPRDEPERYAFVVLRPRRVQAWRESNELPGRLLMRDGHWLDQDDA